MDTAASSASAAKSTVHSAEPGFKAELLLWMTAGVLSAAAALKVLDLARFSLFSGTLVLLEVMLAAALVLDRNRRRAWSLAVLVFSVLAAVAAGKVLAGAADCGCFGVLAVHPAWTLALDLTVLCALYAVCPLDHLRRRVGPLAIGILGGLAIGSAAWATAHAMASDEIILPEQWVGRRLPVLDQIDIGPQLAVGSWTVLFVRHGCPACHEQLALLRRNQAGLSSVVDNGYLLDKGFGRIAVIEVSGSEAELFPGSSRLVTGRLRGNTRRLVLPTPLVVTLDDGIAQRIGSSWMDD